MTKPLKFVKLNTSIKGVMTRAVSVFDRYLNEDPHQFHWVCADDPALIARVLEVLADDLPEEDISLVATRLPYLMVLFCRQEDPVHIPVEATLAFLSVLNRAEMVTLLRQCTAGKRMAPFFDLKPAQWMPLFFLLGGVPDLGEGTPEPSHCSFFLAELP